MIKSEKKREREREIPLLTIISDNNNQPVTKATVHPVNQRRNTVKSPSNTTFQTVTFTLPLSLSLISTSFINHKSFEDDTAAALLTKEEPVSMHISFSIK